MKKYMRTTRFSAVILAFSLILFAATPQRANALFFFDPFESVVTSTLNIIETLVQSLSKDIGSMADRILVMADKIGEMSDRIVHTEELMVAAASKSTVSNLILSPAEGTFVSPSIPIQISLSSEKIDYLLYISNQADMSGSTNALVQNGDTSVAWSRITDFATGNKIYIAVKTIEANSNSDFSNTVMLTL